MRSDEAPSPAFFKIILQRTIQTNKLMIPPKFVRENSNLFMDFANLIIPNGESWRMGLTKSDDKTCLDGNWQEFMQHFSLQEKYMLTFRPKGTSTLEVCIFDHSGCEIHYPAANPARKTNYEEGESSNGEAMDVKPIKTEMPCLNIRMKPYHLKHGMVHLPTKFAKILKKAPEHINLRTSPAQTWRVRLRKQVVEGKYDRFRLEHGWGKFLDDNHMEVGDVCAIQFTYPNLWEVTIFRG
ncbi:B3 domain-containing protein Os03g0212300-like [Mercurialis annua]|uniref:B3 domain-containing protein Os03g0212300-like n=1 Tax=Mercurialis annua TaxID=3986 RepID=UPI00216005C9|nr:B3 domain-containing protein Os03g0212300-like [Mercurialis annua]